MRRGVRFRPQYGHVEIYQEVRDKDTDLVRTDRIVIDNSEREEWEEIKRQVDKYFEIVLEDEK